MFSLTSIKIFLPLMKQGFQQMAQGLLSDTFLEAHVSIYICFAFVN